MAKVEMKGDVAKLERFLDPREHMRRLEQEFHSFAARLEGLLKPALISELDGLARNRPLTLLLKAGTRPVWATGALARSFRMEVVREDDVVYARYGIPDDVPPPPGSSMRTMADLAVFLHGGSDIERPHDQIVRVTKKMRAFFLAMAVATKRKGAKGVVGGKGVALTPGAVIQPLKKTTMFLRLRARPFLLRVVVRMRDPITKALRAIVQKVYGEWHG